MNKLLFLFAVGFVVCASIASAATAEVTVKQWYPKYGCNKSGTQCGHEYVFECKSIDYTPLYYFWRFGDGHSNPWGTNNVFYRFNHTGTYEVSCTPWGNHKWGTGEATGKYTVVIP